MPLIYADRVKETTTTTGTGTLTLAGAASGHQSFAAVGNANTCVYGLEASDGAWEVGIGTYTLSGTTLARTTILASSNAGSAITLPAGTHNVYVTAESSALRNGFLRNKAESPTTAGVTGEVGTMHVLDISGLTADRDFTLPATAAVGDRVGVLLSAGDATYELLIKPAAGDTINGGTAGAEWSRLFITGESVVLRCVTADSAWIVESTEMHNYKFFARQTGNVTAQQTFATDAIDPIVGGVLNTLEYDTGNSLTNIGTAGTDVVFTARRAGVYAIGGLVVVQGTAASADKKRQVWLLKNAGAGGDTNSYLLGRGYSNIGLSTTGISGSIEIELEVGDAIKIANYSEEASTTANQTVNYFVFYGRWLTHA